MNDCGAQAVRIDAEGKVAPRPIKTSTMAGADFIVDSGLKGGERIIVNGLQKARPGAVVKPVPWTPGAPLLAAPPGAAKPPATAPSAPAAKPADEKK